MGEREVTELKADKDKSAKNTEALKKKEVELEKMKTTVTDLEKKNKDIIQQGNKDNVPTGDKVDDEEEDKGGSANNKKEKVENKTNTGNGTRKIKVTIRKVGSEQVMAASPPVDEKLFEVNNFKDEDHRELSDNIPEWLSELMPDSEKIIGATG